MRLKQSLCLFLLAGAAAGVSAQAGTITFSGTAKQATCVSNVNGGGVNGSVALGEVSVTDFPAGGGDSYKPMIQFTIALTGCTPYSTPYSRFYHTTSATREASNSHIIKVLTGSNNLGIKLLLNNTAKNSLAPAATQPASPSRHSGDPVVTTNSVGAATLTYYVKIASNGVVTAGPFSTNVGYLIDYD